MKELEEVSKAPFRSSACFPCGRSLVLCRDTATVDHLGRTRPSRNLEEWKIYQDLELVLPEFRSVKRL